MNKRYQNFESRQSMKKDTFEVFHYIDENFEPVPVHHHDFYEIYFFLGGTAEYYVEDKSYCLQPGDLLLINPYEMHCPIIGANQNYERMVIWADMRFLSGLREPGEDLRGCFNRKSNLLRPTKIQSTTIRDIANELVKEYYSESEGSQLASLALFIRFMVEINRASSADGTFIKDQGISDGLHSRVLAYINEHYKEQISLDKLAKDFYVSRYYLSHEFSKAFGVSVYSYVIAKRLMEARQLILSGMGPADVCREVGYTDYSSFYRAFTAQYGVSPGRMERELSANEN